MFSKFSVFAINFKGGICYVLVIGCATFEPK